MIPGNEERRMRVELRSVGNPDFNQDPGRPLPGVRARWAVVRDFEAASKACLDYIREHGLGGGNWAGGKILDDGGSEVGRVGYTGAVWPPGGPRLHGERLWPPPGRDEEPADPFKFGAAEIPVDGFGTVRVSGCFRVGTVQSLPRQCALVDGRVVEFSAWVQFGRDGTSEFHQQIQLLVDGDLRNAVRPMDAAMAAGGVILAVRKWYATPEGRALVMRNEILDACREADRLETRVIPLHEEELGKARAAAAAERARAARLERDLAEFARGGEPEAGPPAP
jgi:hypothetical protein